MASGFLRKEEMINDRINRIAKKLVAARYTMLKDLTTRSDVKFNKGDSVEMVEYGKGRPFSYSVTHV